MIHSLLARMPVPVKLGIPLASALLATACGSAAGASPSSAPASSAPAAGSSASASTTGTVIATHAGSAGARPVSAWALAGVAVTSFGGPLALAAL